MSGRPPKESLDFSAWDVSILDNDEKIDMLIDAQGIGAFTVYFYLCQKAYGSKGYYLDWGYSRCATIARKLGKGASAEYVKQVVDMCFQCCLFDKRLFELYGILTSKGIQRRYVTVAKERTAPQINDEFWLLSEEESAGLVSHTQKSNYEGSKLNYEGSKLNYEPQKESTVKYSKVNKRKGKESIPEPPTAAVQKVIQDYQAWIGTVTPAVQSGITDCIANGMEPELMTRLFQYAAERNAKNWSYVKAVLAGNMQEGIRTLARYNARKNPKNGTGTAKPSKFNNYQDAPTDWDALEEKIMDNYYLSGGESQ